MTFRVLFVVAVYYNLDINQIDIKTAFLYDLINQLIYIQIPKGSKSQAIEEMVCKLLKALYDFKQAPKLWYEKLSKFLLEKLGLQQINTNHNIFISSTRITGPIVSTFVDNIKIMGVKDSKIITNAKKGLTAAFEMADMGLISFYLKLKVT